MLYKLHSLLYRKDALTASGLFDELNYFINMLPEWEEKKECWMIAHPTQKMIAINNSRATDDVLNYIDSLISKNKNISIVLADESEDDSIITIWYKNTPTVSANRYTLSITMKSLIGYNDLDTFLNVFNQLIKYNGLIFKYILLDTEQYRFNQKTVFDDRLPVGWMLYLPIKIGYEDVPSAYKLYYPDHELGTIVISNRVFNGSDSKDILRANDIEIELAANGLLPLIAEL
ncbi:immunity 52 family protein [Salmonella enterica]|nr:immunity 52 family protein [Salmonella enterica]